jgi:hypothetical protein
MNIASYPEFYKKNDNYVSEWRKHNTTQERV